MVEERALVLYFVSGIEMILIHPSRDFKQVTWSSGGCILQANTHTHTQRAGVSRRDRGEEKALRPCALME